MLSTILLAANITSPNASLAPIEARLSAAYEHCHHWSEEEAYNAARERAIDKGRKRDCAAAIKLAEKVWKDGTKDPKACGLILRIVDAAEVNGHAAKTWKERAPSLCSTAATYFATIKPDDDPDAQSTVLTWCPELGATLYKTTTKPK